MKLLRNPIVVAVLVVAAVALVGNSLLPVLRRGSPAAPAPSAAPKPAAVKPAVAAAPAKKETVEIPPAAPPAAGPVSKVDWALVQTNALRWVEAPRRDPFQVRDWPGHFTGTNPPASDFLTLNGIWRQTGSTLAVINSSVVGEGDDILQFKIQSIEADRVWVYGPAGVEFVSFKSIGSEDATTEPGATEKKPPAPTPGAAPRPR
jgi:hypothetical protein